MWGFLLLQKDSVQEPVQKIWDTEAKLLAFSTGCHVFSESFDQQLSFFDWGSKNDFSSSS